ncbi:hypothetical protein [Maridesulfovibrio zosterae]|uniref:hypothetical protein n=1 Tax=Maridesulfovibrio zosterae TaxID=82171 RepID=UPI000400999D|nr:hypothetical protein [Maridesulfovibrio zosterae]
MKKMIAFALLVGSLITAFYGFAITGPMLEQKSMSRINDMLGTACIEEHYQAGSYDTSNRCVPFYIVSVLAAGAGIFILSELREDDDEEFL